MRRRRKADAEPTTDDAAAAPAEQAVATVPEPSANGHPEPPAELKNRPIKTFSTPASAGVYIEAAVWGREIEVEGRTVTVYSATLRKNYKTDDGWGHTAFLRTSEIAVAVHVLGLTATWMLNARTTEAPPPES